jgi:hypothetical protein
MKFYRENSNNFLKTIIYHSTLTCVYNYNSFVFFYKNSKKHNSKNAAYIDYNGYKAFCLNDKFYGNERKFTKLSWRRFVKMQVLL